MLVLTRKLGEGIAIGDDVKIVVMQIKGKQVRLGIKASPSTVVHREEIYQKIHDENKLAARTSKASLESLSEVLDGVCPPAGPITRSPLRTRTRMSRP